MKTEHEAFGSDGLGQLAKRFGGDPSVGCAASSPYAGEPLREEYQGEALGEKGSGEAVPLGEEPRRYETCAGCGEKWNVSRMAREGWYICPRCAYRYGRR